MPDSVVPCCRKNALDNARKQNTRKSKFYFYVSSFTEPFIIVKMDIGSPNNNAHDFPGVYERPIDKHNWTLLFPGKWKKYYKLILSICIIAPLLPNLLSSPKSWKVHQIIMTSISLNHQTTIDGNNRPIIFFFLYIYI